MNILKLTSTALMTYGIALGVTLISTLTHASMNLFEPTEFKVEFKQQHSGVCSLLFTQTDFANRVSISALLSAGMSLKNLNSPGFIFGGYTLAMDSNNQPIKKSSLPQFSRRTDGDYFPSYELFDDLINRPSNDSFSTNLSSAAQDSLRSTVLELATRAWQVSALYRQGGAKDAMREMGYRWKQITPSAEIRTTLKIKPNEILKFFECALPVIRHSTDDLGIPKSHPSYSLICDEEYIDPVLKVELPVSSIQIYEKDRVAVLEKLGQRKVYDLVIFDESTHSGRLNEQIFHLFTTASDDLKSPLWNLADSQYGGYDSFSRFNAITFRKSESDQYPWRKLETWRDLDYQIDIIDRGCRYE